MPSISICKVLRRLMFIAQQIFVSVVYTDCLSVILLLSVVKCKLSSCTTKRWVQRVKITVVLLSAGNKYQSLLAGYFFLSSTLDTRNSLNMAFKKLLYILAVKLLTARQSRKGKRNKKKILAYLKFKT